MEKPKDLKGCVLRGKRWHYKRRLRPPISDILGQQNLIVNLKSGDTSLAAQRAKEARSHCDNVIEYARRAIQGGRTLYYPVTLLFMECQLPTTIY